jgi:hypothetical protein
MRAKKRASDVASSLNHKRKYKKRPPGLQADIKTKSG